MVPSDDVCGRCNRPLIQKVIHQAALLVCTYCHTVTLQQSEFERLVVYQDASASLDPSLLHDTVIKRLDEDEPLVLPPKRQPPMFVALLAITATIICSFAVIGLIALFYVSRPKTAPFSVIRPRVTDDQPMLPPMNSGALETPEPQAPKPNEPPPSTVPQVVPKAAPKSMGTLISQGWKTVDSHPQEAARIFHSVISKHPANADANYGYGYALLATGRTIDARPFLCRALSKGNAEIKREVGALLKRHQLTCT